MSNFKIKILLGICAITGSIAGYYFATFLFGSMPFWKYILFEFAITVLHTMYNFTKEQALQTVKK